TRRGGGSLPRKEPEGRPRARGVALGAGARVGGLAGQDDGGAALREGAWAGRDRRGGSPQAYDGPATHRCPPSDGQAHRARGGACRSAGGEEEADARDGDGRGGRRPERGGGAFVLRLVGE